MIELSPGRCIYIYDSHLARAYAKKTATATACFLPSCFYRDDELVGRSLGGKNGKQCVDTDILESILSKYNYDLTIILITIIKMFTLHELVFERAAYCSELGILKILTEYFFSNKFRCIYKSCQ